MSSTSVKGKVACNYFFYFLGSATPIPDYKNELINLRCPVVPNILLSLSHQSANIHEDGTW